MDIGMKKIEGFWRGDRWEVLMGYLGEEYFYWEMESRDFGWV